MKKQLQFPEKGDNSASISTNITPLDQRPDSDRSYVIESPSRRQFLMAAGKLTAAGMAAGTVGLSSLAGAATTRAAANQSTNFSLHKRRARAFEIREKAAIFQLNRNFPDPQNNGDEGRYPDGIASFSKALPHNQLGEVDRNAYRKLLQAISSGKPSAFDQVPLGGTARLANPQSAFAFELEGADPHSLSVQPPPRFADEEFAGEMAECYWLALARDIPYSQYGKEPVTAAAINDLRRFTGYASVNAQNLFRGDFPGVQIGPYISQFLLQSYLFGTTPVQQRYRMPIPGTDHITSYQTWLDVQNGNPVPSAASFEEVPRYVRNGRDLGECVHRDFIYQCALVAALILLGYGNAALDDANPYKVPSNQSGFVTFGAPHVLDLIGRVANHALKAAWYQKWVVHRRLRPEEFCGRIHNHMIGAARYPIHAKLLDSQALAAVFSKYGTYLCPQAYPEGCPTHPAFPGGHATFIGAGVTVLKAFFNESFVIPNPVVPSDDGLSLQPWNGEPLTVGNELNKLAFNIAIGRDTTGVHFRKDELEGVLLGEASAFSVLTDFNATYNENFGGFSLTKLDGTAMTLDANPAP
jgi:PAP2 superfamily